MKEIPLFITFHGIDGTGKTTTAENVTQKLVTHNTKTINYDVYECDHVKNPFAPAKEGVKNEASPSSQLAFYLGSTIYHSDRIRTLLDEGFTVVKSRYIDDVLAHHTQLGVKHAKEIADLFPIIQPDLRVILTTDEAARRERIFTRDELDSNDEDVRQAGSRLDFFEHYLLDNAEDLIKIGKAIKIDTTNIDPEQVADKVIDHLFSMGKFQGSVYEQI
jgi:thymidylate kinase